MGTDKKHQYQEEVNKGAERMTRKDLSKVVMHADKILDTVAKVEVLKKFSAQAALLIRMLVDYFDGKYKEVPWKTIAMGVFAFIYLLNPADLIPDYIPVIGFLDDAAVLGIVWQAIKWDVKDYVEFYCTNSLADKKMIDLAKEAFGKEVQC